MTDAAPLVENVYIALLHHPVYDKNGQIVTTAVTNLDIHDIARAARTFGLGCYYIVTPVPEQQRLVQRVIDHWREGWGASYNPKRREALQNIVLANDLQEVETDLARRYGNKPKLITTGARKRGNSIGYTELGRLIDDPGQPWLLVFGTGWGLTEEIMTKADFVLEPIYGRGDYNHLSVRSAVSIILDRLLGNRSV
ncbi:RNA methyltransferase [Geobacter sp. DSM 9736]|uniref:RNA methyltransferase n=1 Tax=Geobacter sp. DSM 9736 TaxID=1277350 RepID=UPI000B5033E9|nr:RNA methyltransferase [Geobacter sp. DSM 9736]SNB46364.1 hypothetical protein SAMN06269301_1819 [Geobacter sp. DSM 9736]